MKVRQPTSEPSDVAVSREQPPAPASGRPDPRANPWGIWLPTAGLDPRSRRRTAALLGLRDEELALVGKGAAVQLVAGSPPEALLTRCRALGLAPEVVGRDTRLVGLLGGLALLPILAMIVIGPAGLVATVLGGLAVVVAVTRRHTRSRDALRWSATRLAQLRAALDDDQRQLRNLKIRVLERGLPDAAEDELLAAIEVELDAPTDGGLEALTARLEAVSVDRLLADG